MIVLTFFPSNVELCVFLQERNMTRLVFIYINLCILGLAGFGITDKDLIMQLDRSKEVMVKQVESVFALS